MTPRRVFLLVFALLAALGHRGFLAHVARHPDSLGPDSVRALGGLLLRAAAALYVLALARAAGALALRRFRLWFASTAEQAVYECALGLGLLSYALFALGLCGLWTREAFLVLLALGAYPAWRARPKLALPALTDHVEAALAAVLAAAALKAVIASGAPPADWDALAVHLEMPRIYARSGAFTPVLWMFHGMDAMAAGLFFVPALAFGAEGLCPLLMSLFGGLMLAAVLAGGTTLAGRRPALAAAALLACSPAFAAVIGSCGSDFAVGLWGMLAFGAAYHGRRGGKGWLLLSGVFAGLAAATKISGLLLGAALFPVILHDCRKRGEAGLARLWAGAAVLACAPWLIRCAAYTGNPVFPYFPALFGGDARELFLGERARRSVVVGLADAFGGAWPLLLPLGLLLARLKRDEWSGRLLAYAGAFGALWTWSQPQWRYMIPLLPWLYLLAARAAHGTLPSAALALGLLPAFALGANNEAFAALAVTPSDGSSPRDAYLSRRVDAWPAMRKADLLLPPGAKLLLYREVRGYLVSRPYLVGDPQNEIMVPYERLPTPDALRRHLGSLGITHVLVNLNQQPFAPLPDFMAADARMGETLARYATLKDETGGVRLYELKRL